MIFSVGGGIALCLTSGLAVAGGPQTQGPDVQVCRLYGLDQKSRSGQLNGFSIATTSYNAGDETMEWFANPNPLHPYITYNLYRMSDERVEQIGVSWIKHGFLSVNGSGCEQYNGCNPTTGTLLFPDCDDTYGSGLNASRTYLGPRYEVNPWSGEYVHTGSFLDGGAPPIQTAVDRHMIIHDQELVDGVNAGMDFYAEGYYVAHDDVKHMNNASYRIVGTPTFDPNPGGNQNYWSMSSSSTVDPMIGWVVEEWGGDESFVFYNAGGTPKEGISPDGRCLLSSKVFDNGDGTWDYEYVMLNIDMDAQVKSFSVPFSPGTTITNAGFHAPQHYEDMNATPAAGGTPIDSSAWTIDVQSDNIKFSTTSNPIRWGTAYNFRFTADQAPADGTISVEPFKNGLAPTYTATNRVPSPIMNTTCAADFDSDGDVDLTDFGTFGAAFGSMTGDANYDAAADFDNDGDVDLTDFGSFGAEFGNTGC